MKSVKLKNSLLVFGLLIACLLVCPKSMAQDAEITTEELTQYAQVSAKIDSLKSAMKAKISEAVKSNELMDGGKMYNQLNKAKGDEAKVAETGATEEQLAAYAEIQSYIKELKAGLKTQTTEAVKSIMSISDFNKVKKTLKADAEIKAQYDDIVASLETEVESTAGGE